MEGEPAADDRLGFAKSIRSDVGDKNAVNFLLEVQSEDKELLEMTRDDLDLLATMLSVVVFRPGDKIIRSEPCHCVQTESLRFSSVSDG
jgi:hypothetical protein